MLNYGKLKIIFGLGTSVLFAAPVTAQLIPDRTLGHQRSRVKPDVNIRTINYIDGGARRGKHLFHSFREFNVGRGRGVYFTNPAGVTNIFNRVTGNNLSRISGTLGVLGNANLFLINPNGIIFSQGAKLDLNGSFFGTTASSVLFDNNFEFSARNPENIPIELKINFPIGFNFGRQPGDILVRGNGSKVTGSLFGQEPVETQNNIDGLRLLPDKTLALLGGDIILDGGVLNAEGGRIELASITGVGRVNIVSNSSGEYSFDYQNLPKGNITLKQRSLLNASSPAIGTNAGSIGIDGGSITLADGSILLLSNTGQASGNIEIRATDSILISGISADKTVRSGVRTQLFPTATNKEEEGNISISTNNLILEDGGGIIATTYSLNPQVRAGNVNVSADNLTIRNGSPLSSVSFGTARGGDLDINVAGDIQISGFLPSSPQNIRNAISLIVTNGGNINLSAQNLTLTNLGTIASSNLSGTRVGGDIIINTDSIKIIGANRNSLGQPLVSIITSSNFSSGNGGDIRITTARLSLLDGGVIGSSTVSNGNAGNVEINASESIKIAGIAPNTGFSSSIQASASILPESLKIVFPLLPSLSGDSGNLSLYTPNLAIENGGQAIVLNQGSGSAGILSLNLERLALNNNAQITATSASGLGGQINVRGYNNPQRANTITLNNNSSIATNNATSINPTTGTIDIATRNLFLNNGSEIAASVGVTPPDVASSSSTQFFNIPGILGGNININATEKVYLDGNSSITATVENQPNGNISGGNINITAGSFRATNNSLVSASVNERGNGGDINISVPERTTVILDNSDIRANAIDGDGGNINIVTQAFFRSFDSEVDASSRAGQDGIVSINILTPSTKTLFVTQPEQIQFDFEDLGNQFCLSPQRHGLRKVKIRNDVPKWATPQYHTESWDVYFTEAPPRIESWYDVIEPNAMVHTKDGRSYSTALCVRPRAVE